MEYLSEIGVVTNPQVECARGLFKPQRRSVLRKCGAV